MNHVAVWPESLGFDKCTTQMTPSWQLQGALPDLLQRTGCCCATLQRLHAVQLSFECNLLALVQHFQPQAMSGVTMPQQSELGQEQLMHAATASI